MRGERGIEYGANSWRNRTSKSAACPEPLPALTCRSRALLCDGCHNSRHGSTPSAPGVRHGEFTRRFRQVPAHAASLWFARDRRRQASRRDRERKRTTSAWLTAGRTLQTCHTLRVPHISKVWQQILAGGGPSIDPCQARLFYPDRAAIDLSPNGAGFGNQAMSRDA